MKKIIAILFTSILAVAYIQNCFAEDNSFGISPPIISNQKLLPGSVYRQEIFFSRATPDEAAKAIIEISDSSIKNWLNFEPGLEIDLPAGVQQVKATAVITVPANAALGSYQGTVIVKLQKQNVSGQIILIPAVALQVDLGVSNEKTVNLKVLTASIPDFAGGSPLVLVLKVANVGNSAAKFSNVKLELQDLLRNPIKTLESNDLSLVQPNSEEEIAVNFSNPQLATGEYVANVKVYYLNEIKYDDRLSFNVLVLLPTFTALPQTGNTAITASPANTASLILIAIGIFFFIISIILILLILRREKSQDQG